MTDAEDDLSDTDREPDETLAAPAGTGASDPVAALPRVAMPVYRPRNRWLRAFFAAAILGAAAVVVIVLLVH